MTMCVIHVLSLNIRLPFMFAYGVNKDRNGMDLTESEDIKKRWQEYTEELYKKDHHDPDNHDEYDHSPRARHPGM